VSAGVGDGAATLGTGVGVLVFTVTLGAGCGLRSAAIWSNFGFTKTKNTPTKAAPPNTRKRTTRPMISGSFDFFFAGGAGSGADGAGVGTAGIGTSAVTCCSAAGGGGGGGGAAATGGGGGGGAGGGVAGGREMSEVFGVVEVGPVVGPVLRGSATVAG